MYVHVVCVNQSPLFKDSMVANCFAGQGGCMVCKTVYAPCANISDQQQPRYLISYRMTYNLWPLAPLTGNMGLEEGTKNSVARCSYLLEIVTLWLGLAVVSWKFLSVFLNYEICAKIRDSEFWEKEKCNECSQKYTRNNPSCERPFSHSSAQSSSPHGYTNPYLPKVLYDRIFILKGLYPTRLRFAVRV